MAKINLGTRGEKTGPMSVGRDKQPSVSYPSFQVNDIKLPLTSADVGKKIKVEVTLMVNKAGAEIDEWGNGKKRFRSSFSICDIDFKKTKIDFGTSKDEMDDAEYREYMSGRKR
jgi:hypothetical protein